MHVCIAEKVISMQGADDVIECAHGDVHTRGIRNVRGIRTTMDTKKLDRKLVITHVFFIADWRADGA